MAVHLQGENCSCGSRLLVQSSVKDAVLEKVVAIAKSWKLGDPTDPEVCGILQSACFCTWLATILILMYSPSPSPASSLQPYLSFLTTYKHPSHPMYHLPSQSFPSQSLPSPALPLPPSPLPNTHTPMLVSFARAEPSLSRIL